MRVKVVSRASDLAVLQAKLVARALTARWPQLEIVTLTRSSLGDRDDRIGLWDAADKGVFTADLSTMVARGDADLAVHSWKDLPADENADTRVAGTLPRADARDVLLFRREALTLRPPVPIVLTSSPRRAWQLGESLGPLLPWPVTGIEPRGNTQVIQGEVPLASMFGYATDLRSRTQGRATYSMQFARYAPVPAQISDEIVGRKSNSQSS